MVMHSYSQEEKRRKLRCCWIIPMQYRGINLSERVSFIIPLHKFLKKLIIVEKRNTGNKAASWQATWTLHGPHIQPSWIFLAYKWSKFLPPNAEVSATTWYKLPYRILFQPKKCFSRKGQNSLKLQNSGYKTHRNFAV